MIQRLRERCNVIVEPVIDIDYTKEFPSIGSMSPFERGMLHTMHRYFVHRISEDTALMLQESVLLVSRGIYDSLAYTQCYLRTGEIDATQAERLHRIAESFPKDPSTIVLNPSPHVILERLTKRRSAGTRAERDRLFRTQDTKAFVENLQNEFSKLRALPNVLYLEDNEDQEIDVALAWLGS